MGCLAGASLRSLGHPVRHGGRGIACTRIGGPLSFEPIWQRLGIGAVLNALLQGRGLEFAVERAVFASVLRQLFVSGSDSTDFVARPSGR